MNIDILLSRIRELAFLNKGIGLTLMDERTGCIPTHSCMKAALIEYVTYLNQKREVLHEDPIYVEGSKG